MQSSSFLTKLEDFELFWIKEWPRFGESGSTGWSSYYHLHDITPIYESIIPTLPALTLNNSLPDKSNIMEWVNHEQSLRLDRCLPIRTCRNDLIINRDPYQCILFEDISPFLLELTHPNSQTRVLDDVIQLLILPCYNISHTNNSNPFQPINLPKDLFNQLSLIPNEPFKLIYDINMVPEQRKLNPIDWMLNLPLSFDTIDLFSIDQFNPKLINFHYREFIINLLIKISTLLNQIQPIILALKIMELFDIDR